MKHTKLCNGVLITLLMVLLCAAAYAEFENPTRNPDAPEYDISKPGDLRPEQIVARSFVLMDADTGEILMEREADMQYDPVLVAPIVNAMTALRLGGDPEDTIYASPSIKSLDEDLAVLPLSLDEEILLKDAIYAMMLQWNADVSISVADAYVPIRDYVPGDYVSEMNETVREIGCENTLFGSVLGFRGETQYTTALDQAYILAAAMENSLLRQALGTSEYKLHATTKHPARTITSTNLLITHQEDDIYYNQDVTGGKTAFTNDTGYVLAAMAERDGHRLIASVVYSGKYSRWPDVSRLLNYGFYLLEVKEAR